MNTVKGLPQDASGTRWLWFLLAMLGIAAYLAWDIHKDHRNVEAEERARLMVRVRLIELNLERQLIAVDRSLRALAGTLDELLPGGVSTQRVKSRFTSIVDAIPGVRSLVLVNQQGICIASTRDDLIGINFSDGERYRTMSRDANADRLYVSAPFKTPTGIFAIGLGKVIVDRQGAFSGYLLAVVDPEFFDTLLGSMLYAPDMRTAVIHADGSMIYLIPSPQQRIGANVAQPGSLFAKYLQSGETTSVQNGAAVLSGEQRTTALRTLRTSAVKMDQPLVVMADRSTAAIFAAWRHQSVDRAVLFGLLLLTGSGGLLFHQRRRRGLELHASRIEAERRQAEDNLRQSEANLAATLQSMGDGVIVTDATGCVTLMNATAEKLTAWPIADARGRALADVLRLVDARSRTGITVPIEKVLDTGEKSDLADHTVLVARDGAEYYISENTAPIRQAHGTRSGVVVVFRDVTERYREQLAIAEREALLSVFAEHAQVGIVLVTQDHRYAFVNAAYAKSHRRSVDDILGRHLSEVLGDLYASRARADLERAFAGHRIVDEFALSYPTSASPLRHVEVVLEPPVQTSRGLCVVTVVTDITERKRADAEQGQLAAIFKGTHDAIVLRAPDDSVVDWNDAAERLFGWRTEEALGRKFRDFVSDANPGARHHRLEKVLAGEILPMVEDRRRRKDGSLVDVETTMSPVRDHNGAIIAVASIMRDVTERKKADRHRNLLAAAIESSNNAIFILDAQRKILYCNRMVTEMFGYGPEEIVGRDTDFMVLPEYREARRANWARLEGGMAIRNYETVRVCKDGRRVDVALSASVVKDEGGNQIGIVTVIRDISERKRAEAELLASRNQLRSALEAMSDAVFISDVNGRLIDFNEAFATFHRFRSKADCARTLDEYPRLFDVYSVAGELLPLHQWAVPRALRGESGAGVEFGVRRKDSGERWVGSYTFAPIHDVQGAIVGSVVTARDISERKQSELARARLAAIVENSTDAILSRDLDGTILSWNKGAERMLGYAAEDVIGRSVDLTLPPGRPPNRDGNNEVARKGQTFVRETTRLTKDGRVLQVRGSYAPLCDEAGEMTGLSMILQDITALKQAEAARNRLAAIVENSNDAIFSRTLAGTILTWNKGAERMLGYTAQEAVGQSADFTLAPEHSSQMARNSEAVLRGEGLVNDSVRIARDGRTLYVRASYSPLRDPAGDINGVSVILQDVTALKQAEAAQRLLEGQLIEAQKMQAIGTLAGGIAHDFNNIIATIIGNAELARDDAAGNVGVLESVVEILKASERAKHLVKQILSFSRRQPAELHWISLEPVIQESARLLRSTISRRISLDVRCEADVPRVMADATQIQQVLINLSTNAAHAIPSGPGRIRITLDSVTLDASLASTHAALQGLHDKAVGSVARIVVADTGTGMDAATLKRIFEPFFTTKSVNEGTGLGLAVVHGIVQGHGGAIVVESEPGQGSTFSVYLPIAEGDGAASAGDAVQTGNAGVMGSVTGLRVLYIDDDEMLVDLVSRVLGRRGYRVSAFGSATKALETLRADPAAFDVVLSDYNMPETSGLDVARAVRGIRETLPVVLISGFIDDALIAQASDAGVRELLSKVDSAAELCAAIERMVKTL